MERSGRNSARLSVRLSTAASSDRLAGARCRDAARTDDDAISSAERGLTEPDASSPAASTGCSTESIAGVFAVGHPPAPARLAGWRRCSPAGPGALLSHRAAAALWGIRESQASRIDVSSLNRAGYTAEAIALHRAGALDDEDREVRLEIPVTSLPRTIVDLATVLAPSALEYAIHRAEVEAADHAGGDRARALATRRAPRNRCRRRDRPRPPPRARGSVPDEARAPLPRDLPRLRDPRAEVNAWIALDDPGRRARGRLPLAGGEARRRGRRGREPPHPPRAGATTPSATARSPRPNWRTLRIPSSNSRTRPRPLHASAGSCPSPLTENPS